MQDAPERVWAIAADEVTDRGYWGLFNTAKRNVSYTRTDLCITDAECQRRIDAAVQAERDAWYAAISQQFGNLMAIHTEVKAAAIRAWGQK